ncbi:hypothetical protein [Methylophaga lonarensis]|uniref:hypothetical protein n=1 Tax=Methylophaga lonarensis TaxID=999151 RepID=UPI0003454400|nr:hypothetical protein [Methylophaga lonarensis]
MKFSILVAIVPEELEQPAIDAAKELGAGGITLMGARGISNSQKKNFFLALLTMAVKASC